MYSSSFYSFQTIEDYVVLVVFTSNIKSSHVVRQTEESLGKALSLSCTISNGLGLDLTTCLQRLTNHKSKLFSIRRLQCFVPNCHRCIHTPTGVILLIHWSTEWSGQQATVMLCGQSSVITHQHRISQHREADVTITCRIMQGHDTCAAELGNYSK